jgi:DNA-binding HxlR family transcriptional regulator
MVKRTSMECASCPIARSLDAIGDWWSLLIVREAFSGARRFGDFQKRLGMAKNILATRLRDLVAEGILKTRPAADGSAYHEYVLTRKGVSLHTVIIALHQWGQDNLFEPGEATTVILEKATRRPVSKLQIHSADGVPLRLEDLTVIPAVAASDLKPA